MNPHQPGPPRRVFWRLSALTAAIAAGVWLALWYRQHQTDDTPPQPTASPLAPLPLPPFTESRFLTTRGDAKPIGTAACGACHTKNHQSYLLTNHSRSLSDIDPATEAPDGLFTHQASGRTYRVYRRDGQFRHEELLKAPDGQELGRADYPMRYLIGSGQSVRAYAVEVDGFLQQSPLGWYATKKQWDMSPGYDGPNHASFERPILLECLACHAGRVEQADRAVNRLRVTEKAIGCENCHGPGSLHQDFHRSQKLAPGEDDLTIVNPAKLSRELKDSICSSCHLSDQATVSVRGRHISDFQPGRPLSDYRIHYRPEGADDSMSVVGHVDQLHQSACYQKSSEMTCLTCHDPHRPAPAPAGDRVAFFRDKCLSCHTTQPCKVELAERLKKEPADNCMTCHMPRSKTEVPHVAFTHHRIGLHPRTASPPATRAPILVPTGDFSQFSSADRLRNLGLAYLNEGRRSSYAPHAIEYRDRARTNLEAAYAEGLRDPETMLGLAEIASQTNPGRDYELANEVLADANTPSGFRAMALTIVAYHDSRYFDGGSAARHLEELGGMRRFAEDWRLLGTIYLRQNAPAKALPAFQKALEIRPFRAATHFGLADTYRQLGNPRLADEHRQKANNLRQLNQD